MELSNPFYVGVSGLRANSQGITLVGNNLANSNTIGFKGSNLFLEELAGAIGGDFNSGQGVLPSATQYVWSQGSIQQSQVSTDMAIDGNGFFVVSDGSNGQFYTRAGNFLIDNTGNLINSAGLLVLGYPVGSNGSIDLSSAPTSMDLGAGRTIAPRTTSEIGFRVNLSSAAAVGETFSTSTIVYDSLGQDHPVVIDFTRAAGGWDYQMTIQAQDVGGLSTDPPVVVNSGTMVFDTQGLMTTPAADISGITISGFTNGASDLTFDWDLFGATGESSFTQFDLESATSATFQNGAGAGTLTGFIVRGDGIIEGVYSNGESEAIGQLALASFSNNQGLANLGGNLFASTIASGVANVGAPDSGGRGQVVGNALEQSNVDIAEEFVKLILFQRGYQASSRVVTTADEITQEAINLKR